MKSRTLKHSVVFVLGIILVACGLDNELTSFNFNGTVGIKTFREYQTHLETVTGQRLSTANLEKLQPRLSQRGRVVEANAVSFLAMTMMAGQSCQAFITSLSNTPGPQRALLQTVDLSTAGAHAAFRSNPDLQASSVEELFQHLLIREASDDEFNIVMQAVAETLAVQGNGTAADLRALYTMVCTIIAASADGMRG